MGQCHVASRIGNSVRFYRWVREKTLIKGGEFVGEITCEGSVKGVGLNERWVAVLTDVGRVVVREIEGGEGKEKVFPL